MLTYNDLKSKIDALEEQLDVRRDRLNDVAEEAALEAEAHSLLCAVSDYILANDPLAAMERVITDVLQRLVSPDIVKFSINTEQKRNQLESYFTVTRRYGGIEQEMPIMSALGGGGIDVVFFIIRIILLTNHPVNPAPILFSDEPVKNLSRDKRDDFMVLLHRIAEEFDIQIPMTTHEEHYIANADHVIKFTLKGGVTHAEESS